LHPRSAKALPRKLSLVSLIAATYFMVGGWPYGIEDTVAQAGYGGAILILLLTPAIWAFPTSLMVAELSSALPQDGGFYIWASRGLGRFWGFQESWLSLVGSVFDMALYPTLFLGYLGHFAPSVTAGPRGIAIGVALIAAAALWNLSGARSVGGGSIVFGLALLAPFAVLSCYAVWHRSAAGPLLAAPHHVDYLAGILLAMWNYMGWDNASTVAGEVQRPQRTYPLAMAGAISIVALNYVLPIAAVSLTGLDPSRWSTGGWADIGRAVFGSDAAGNLLAVVITAGGMLGALGTLNALTLSFSRLPAAMADDGLLPRVLGRRSANGVPWVSVLVCASGWALCLGLTFTKLLMLDVLLTGLSILLEFASLAALRIREPRLPRPYRVPGGLAGAIGIGIAPTALLAIAAFRTEAEPVGPINALELGAILIACGVVAYFIGERIRKS
jgi:amino acid transporter